MQPGGLLVPELSDQNQTVAAGRTWRQQEWAATRRWYIRNTGKARKTERLRKIIDNVTAHQQWLMCCSLSILLNCAVEKENINLQK